MYKILKARLLAENIYEMQIDAPWVAKKCLPGQFVILRVDEIGERIPLTISDYDRKIGSVSIVFQVVGASTLRLSRLCEGDYVYDFVGPLGNPSEIIANFSEFKDKNIIFIAGGVGAAPVYPQVKWLSENGLKTDVIIGSRNKDLLILKQEMQEVCGNLYIATDDGSAGFNGRVTDMLTSLVSSGKKYDLCVAIGPMIMMKYTALLTKKLLP